MDDLNAAKMILSGIPLDESFLQYRLSIMMNEERKGLLEGKLPVTESYYLMGSVDPSGILESDEVCIILYVLFCSSHFVCDGGITDNNNFELHYLKMPL